MYLRRFCALIALLLLLCACGQPAQDKNPAPVESQGSVTTQPEPDEDAPPKPANGFLAEGEDDRLVYYVDGEKQTFAPGVQMIEGKAYYVLSDGESFCDLIDGVHAMEDGKLYGFQSDCSLVYLEAGFNELDEQIYYAEEAGYALSAYAEELVEINGSLYAFAENSTVMQFEAGVQSVFGKTYLISEAGGIIDRHPAGVLLQGLDLYCVQEDGSLLVDGDVGYLHFGSDGRYTSGNETLDTGIRTLFETCLTGEEADTESQLRVAYNYLRDNYRYLSGPFQEIGSTDWAEECALQFLERTKGNCYCWAATVMYCARALGYQATVVSGYESNPSNKHAWNMIEWPDGETYLFDAQLEYAYIYMFANKQPVDMFKVAGDGFMYNGFAYYFPE